METVELRVHGVHGTSPGAMLGVGDHDVAQVAGDGLTGIYRAKEGVTLPHRDLEHTEVSVEAYSWGALTSGVQGLLGWVGRALWLLLLPFALVNLAYWARTELGRPSGQARWGTRAVRLSGLLLTVFFVLTPCVVAIDLGAWQCFRYGSPGCSGIPGQLDFLAGWHPGQRMAFATVLPMLAIAVLWLLSRTSMSRYETVEDPLDAPPVLPHRPVLLHPRLWNATARTERLQQLHLAAGVATVVAFSGIHVLAVTDHLGGTWPGLLLWITVLGSGLVLGSCGVLVMVTHDDDVEPLDGEGPGRRWGDLARSSWSRWGPRLLPATLVLYVLHLIAMGTSHRSGTLVDEASDFVGRNVWFIVVFVGLTLLHITVFVGGRMRPARAVLLVALTAAGPVALAVLHAYGVYDGDAETGVLLAIAAGLVFWAGLAWWHYHRSPANPEKAWRGAGASVLLAAASWIALLFTTGIVIAAANYLNGPDHGVGDLVSQIHRPAQNQPPETRRGLPYEPGRSEVTRFAASGDVTVRRARVVVADGEATVVSGTIEMERLASLSVKGQKPRSGRLAERVGQVRVNETSEVVVPTAELELADSCVGESGRCSAEDGRFRAGSRLLLSQPSGGDVVLVVERGVHLRPAEVPAAPLAVPQVLIWVPIGQLFWLVAVLAALLVCLARFGRGAGRLLVQHWADDADAAWTEPITGRDRPRARAARRSAALAHRAESLLDVVGAITSPIALAVVLASISGSPPWAFDWAAWTRGLATASMWLVIAMSAGLVMLGSQIRRSEKTRKAVGVIWDLTTFWPRAAHPLAPPCYAERVVPELQIRTRWVLDQPVPPGIRPHQVILSGHSQGSLIVLATISRLQPEQLARVRVITYGSQIRALYGRIFPRVFGHDEVGYRPTDGTPTLTDAFPDVPPPPGAVLGPPIPTVDSVRHRLVLAGGAWVSLFRRTDPLGWRVFSDVDSDLDQPVAEVPPATTGDPGPVVMGHSGYQHTRVYRERVAAWTGETVVDVPSSTAGLVPLPRL